MIVESGARSRTRRAILAAAASALARDRAATLADIAAAADVGRSTLQRYFPDRETLIDAVVEDSLRVVGEAVRDAALDQGPPDEAMRRLIAAMVDAGDRVLFLYGEPRESGSAGAVRRLIERGQAAGSFDPAAGADWIEHALWALVYSGCDAIRRGVLPRHGAATVVTRTFEQGVRAS
ncbi:MAG: TetR/AcrR family transcriptional regulator [Gaiellaceae bacterium]